MTPSGEQKQFIEVLEMGVGTSYLIVEVLALRPLNLSANAAFMETIKNRAQTGSQIELVKVILPVSSKSRCGLGCGMVLGAAHLAFC